LHSWQLCPGGVLEIKQVQATVENCGIKCADNKIMLTVELCWGRKTDTLTTKSASSFDGRSATFDEADNFLQFAGPEELHCLGTEHGTPFPVYTNYDQLYKFHLCMYKYCRY